MDRDAVTREQIEAWAKLAGIEQFTELGLARLGDFAIFARRDRSPSAAQLSTETVDKPVDRVGGEVLEEAVRKLRSAQICHTNAVQFLISEAIELLSAASGGDQE